MSAFAPLDNDVPRIRAASSLVYAGSCSITRKATAFSSNNVRSRSNTDTGDDNDGDGDVGIVFVVDEDMMIQ
jgi:hypothetical protein